jgi:hypothetical protein
MREIHALLLLVIVAVVVGLVLRYGATSVPLASGAETAVVGVLNDLTLKGTGYQYYPPESPKGKS